MSLRRNAREYALQILFQYDMTQNLGNLTEHFWAQRKIVPAVRDFANLLVEGVIKNLTEIDDLIQKYTEHWSLQRMPIVDRNILRFAIFEILYLKDIPAKVTINEAIEITKRYADKDSGAFINGILDRILREEGRARPKKEAIERELHAGSDSL